MFGTVVLWAHAISGAAWISASACFVIAGVALTAGSAEQRNFLEHAARRINQLAIAAALALVATGAINLIQALAIRHGTLPPVFTYVLGVKIALFFMMAWALRIAIRASQARAMRPMLGAHAAIVAMGAIALLLGLWLTGT